ncbi:MAG: hypothetical protein ACTSSJ_03240 [Candidatus Odinarchaeia archaeon]
MHLTIEKALGIALTLVLVTAVGVPLTYKAISLISDAGRLQEIDTFIQNVDAAIKEALSGNYTYVSLVYIPPELEFWSKGNAVYYRYNFEGTWNVITYTYDCPVYLTQPENHGYYFLSASLNSSAVYVNFTANS